MSKDEVLAKPSKAVETMASIKTKSATIQAMGKRRKARASMKMTRQQASKVQYSLASKEAEQAVCKMQFASKAMRQPGRSQRYS